MDSELSLKFIGYFPDYLSALSRTLLHFFGQLLSKQLYSCERACFGSWIKERYIHGSWIKERDIFMAHGLKKVIFMCSALVLALSIKDQGMFMCSALFRLMDKERDIHV